LSVAVITTVNWMSFHQSRITVFAVSGNCALFETTVIPILSASPSSRYFSWDNVPKVQPEFCWTNLFESRPAGNENSYWNIRSPSPILPSLLGARCFMLHEASVKADGGWEMTYWSVYFYPQHGTGQNYAENISLSVFQCVAKIISEVSPEASQKQRQRNKTEWFCSRRISPLFHSNCRHSGSIRIDWIRFSDCQEFWQLQC